MQGTPEFLAAFDAEGAFADLVRSDGSGLSFRDRNGWLPYQPGDDSLDGMEIIEVDEEFTEVVDRAMAAKTAPGRDDALKFAPDDGDQSEEGDDE